MPESASLPPGAIDAGAAGDDIVIPFSIVGNQVRGRLMRLGVLITDIIARHDYPPPVSRLTG